LDHSVALLDLMEQTTRSPTMRLVDVTVLFAEVLRSQPNCVPVEPGQRHWDLFTRLCRAGGVKGNLVAQRVPAAAPAPPPGSSTCPGWRRDGAIHEAMAGRP
jgi:hypothetical protein